MNGIDAVKKNATSNERYQYKSRVEGKDYFVLIAKNGEIIGTSEMYESRKNLKVGVKSVKDNAPAVMIEDISQKT